jgi:AraC-like DNA-binding protein
MSSTPPSPSHAPRTLNVAYARVLVNHMAQRKPSLMHTLGPDSQGYLDQQDPMARCTLQAWSELLELAERELGVRDLIPELAEQFKPWHAGLLGFTLMTSNSVLDLAALLRRFHHLLNDVFLLERGVAGGRFFLRLRPASNEPSRRLAHFSLLVWAQRLRWLTGQPDLQLDVTFEGPPPADVMPYQRTFGGTVRFDQGSHTLWGDEACLALPIVSRDTASHGLLQSQALKQLEQLSRTEDRLLERVQALIRTQLGSGKVSLDDVAAALKMPTRTLQRRLEESGVPFRGLIDEVRKLQAQRHLLDTRMPLAELAAALGFADHASFNRAFKRWTGVSPGAYRRAQTQAEDAVAQAGARAASASKAGS